MEKEKKRGGIESRIVNYCFDPLSWSSTIAAEERVCVAAVWMWREGECNVFGLDATCFDCLELLLIVIMCM